MCVSRFLLTFILFIFQSHSSNSYYATQFPNKFIFGVGSSAYQIEGAWNEDGKGENIWDYNLHKNPNRIVDKSNGDVACDSYHLIDEDIELIKNLGVDVYKFSISWTRILPMGLENSYVNQRGVDYYNKLIDRLLDEGIQPCVVISHWDTPQIVEDKGGWLNFTTINDYVYYADLLFTLFGDRVKMWITFNELMMICEKGYDTGKTAPFISWPGFGGYICAHHCLIAHGEIYRLYQKKFVQHQRGVIGISIDSKFGFPKTNSSEDQNAAERYNQFYFGWFVHPLLIGDYPPIMIETIDRNSKLEGLPMSRLPKFTQPQINMINGSIDFLGVNHYTSLLISSSPQNELLQPSYFRDTGVQPTVDPSWETTSSHWLHVVPEGMRGLLNWIKTKYNNPPVIITENGVANSGKLIKDVSRQRYFRAYLTEMLKAIYEDGCNVYGFIMWSIMDNFEWIAGYTQKFGLVYVDFSSANLTRLPKDSYFAFQKIISTRRLI